MDPASIERSVTRRLRQMPPAGRVTVHRTGEPPRVKALVAEPRRPLTVKDKKSGRVFLDVERDVNRTYRTGGVPKRMVRVATVIGEDGRWYETISPRPGSEFVNGLSDKVVNPRRVQRRAKKSKGGGKQRGTVIR